MSVSLCVILDLLQVKRVVVCMCVFILSLFVCLAVFVVCPHVDVLLKCVREDLWPLRAGLIY